jgi:hypothetical protein
MRLGRRLMTRFLGGPRRAWQRSCVLLSTPDSQAPWEAADD